MTLIRILATVIIVTRLFLMQAAIADEPTTQQLLELHTREAKAYRIALDEAGETRLEVQTKPVFAWTNPVGDGVQTGHIFVWTSGGRPEVIGTVFSLINSENHKRAVVHEFHTLSESKLFPERAPQASEVWLPERPLNFQVLNELGPPDKAAVSRLRQMREIARSVNARTIESSEMKRELRLLTTPLMRYAPTAGSVVDGAIFAMVSSDGTDPELLLLIEACKTSTIGDLKWRFAAVRFSDKDLEVERDTQIVWSSKLDPSRRVIIARNYRLLYTEHREYICFRAKEIDELQAIQSLENPRN